MFKQIRTLLQEDTILSGSVKVDKAYFGGKRKNGTGRPIRRDRVKTPVLGIVQRNGGAKAIAIDDSTAKTLVGNVHKCVLPASTDVEGRRYNHRRINHSAAVYVVGDIHTNSVEGLLVSD